MSVAKLIREIEIKARELQGVLESVDSGKRRVTELQEQEQRLTREREQIEEDLYARREELDRLAGLEISLLADLKANVVKEEDRLRALLKNNKDLERENESLQVVVAEAKEYASKAEEYRLLFLEHKGRYDAAETKSKADTERSETAIKALDEKQRAYDAFKEYLTEFSGKVATYTRTAQGLLEDVNERLAKHIPMHFRPPAEPVTMDNFTKTFEV